ncbi:MAG: BppU family phage baseplate upper protein [Oscillospiraceae bacterium]|nr:BppU family phage baseplate upper protein [Oscillospiraceae bacterium]
MIVSSKVTMDFQQPGSPQIINAVQNDQYSRNLEITLYDSGTPWTIPEDVDVLIRYCKSDGTGGEYNMLPDKSAAWNAEGNVLTVALAPQVLTAPGSVTLSVLLFSEEQVLSTFRIMIRVSRSVEPVAADSENYYHIAGESIIAALGYTPASTLSVQMLTTQKVSKSGIRLGIGTDGLLYLYVDNRPVGTGIYLSGGVVGDGGATDDKTDTETTAVLDSAVLDSAVLA